MKRRSPVSRDKIVELTQLGESPEQIARLLKCSTQAVYRAQAAKGVGQPPKRGRPLIHPAKLLKVETPVPTNPMEAIALHFGDQLTEANGAFRLNGMPTSFFELMKRMNGDRKSAGRKQIGHRGLHV